MWICSTQLQLGEIAVEVVLKDIKNIHLSVYPPAGKVRISAPSRMTLDTIRVFAISKLGWIKQQQEKLRGQERETPREYLDRESHLVWRKRYLLKLIECDEEEMANRSAAGSRLIDRRTVLQVAAALAAAGPALMREGHAAARPPVVIDAQVHAYAANTPERPWHSVPNWPAHVTGDEMVVAMDKVGVDGAIYISPFSMYQYDGSYAVSVQRAHPDKFALVKPVNPDDPAVADVIADWKKTPGTVGIRIILTKESKRAPDDPGLDRILRAAVKNDFPVNVLFWGNVDAGTALIDRHPDARFIIDHMGIQQPSVPPAPPQPWADLPKVVELAKRKNAVIKITGACTLSKEPYPFPDIWDPLARIFDAWGFERCLWGTDWTRAFAVVNYEQGVEPFLETDRLSDTERAMLMGGACAKAYGWSPNKA